MTKRLTYEEVKDFIESEGFTLLSDEYTRGKEKLTIRCKKGHEEPIIFNNFKTRRRCPKCAIEERNEKKRIKPDKVKELVESEGHELLEITEGYKGEHKRLLVSCPNKDHEPYPVSYQNFNKGKRCPECKADKNRIPFKEVKDTIESEGFKLLSKKYKSRKHTINVECPQGHIYPTTYDLFLSGKRCGKCNMSRGENLLYFILKNILPENNFYYQYPVTIDNNNYRYDFCVDSDFRLFIEFDGTQHYKSVSEFGGKEGFYQCVASDKVKNDFVENNIDSLLLRVPYFYSIENVYYSVVQYLKENDVLVTEIEDLSKLNNALYVNTRQEDIASYYLTNSISDTSKKFNVHKATVYKYFKKVYGTSKSKYKKEI